VTFRSPLVYSLDVFAPDGAVAERCSMTLACGGRGVDAEDIEQSLSDPALVALFSDDGGVLGVSGFGSPESSRRIIQREDGKKIVLGDCVTPECGRFPEALWGLGLRFDALQRETGTSWGSCLGWRPSR
jgi:hypothetical protein